jgi:uncharacterized membrane protein YgcG
MVGVAVLAAVFAAGAAAPGDVAPVVADEGYFIEVGSDATPAVVSRAVSDGRSAGGLLYAVVLAEEPSGGATTYADAVLDDVPRQVGTVLVVAPQTVGWSSNGDIWTTEQLDRALEASLDGTTSDDVVAAFVSELTDPAAGGGSGWIFLAFVLGIGGVIGGIVWWSRRRRARAAAGALSDLKRRAQEQIDALANDILDDEEEVREAGDAVASDHFDAAAAIYRDAGDRLSAAATAEDVLAVSTDVDKGIWHLDAAEAILDGRPIPPEPEPPKPPPDVRAATPSAGTRTQPTSTSSLPPLPTYERRASRSSGFGADDMLKAVLAMQAMRAVSGGRSRSSGRGSSGRSAGRSSSRSSTSGRSRGGGRRRG